MYYSEKYLNEFEFRKTKLYKTAKLGTYLISDVATRKIKGSRSILTDFFNY